MTKKSNYLIEVIKRKCKSKHYNNFDCVERAYIYDLCLHLEKVIKNGEKVEIIKKINE